MKANGSENSGTTHSTAHIAPEILVSSEGLQLTKQPGDKEIYPTVVITNIGSVPAGVQKVSITAPPGISFASSDLTMARWEHEGTSHESVFPASDVDFRTRHTPDRKTLTWDIPLDLDPAPYAWVILYPHMQIDEDAEFSEVEIGFAVGSPPLATDSVPVTIGRAARLSAVPAVAADTSVKIVGCMLVRNEEWVLGCSLRAALQWCDAVVVMDHASTDATPRILEQVREEVGRDRVVVESWADASRWDEMTQRQRLLVLARKIGGTHFALIDADEILTANFLPHVRDWVGALAPGQVLDMPQVPVWRDLDHYRDDESNWCHSTISIAVADRRGIFWAPADGDAYQHHHRQPRGTRDGVMPTWILSPGSGGMMHLQFAAPNRLLWKHRAYKLFEMLRWPDRQSVAELDAKYSGALDERGMVLSEVPACWWDGYRRELIDPAHDTWWAAECERMWRENNPETFAGLNLWGWPTGLDLA
ncbi:glycosyltransferase family 2 protein [Streptomyces sp. NPDC001667]